MVVVVVVVVMLGSWLVRVAWWRRARCRSRVVVVAWRGPRIWLRQKQRSWDVWIASLGMGMLIIWGLARTCEDGGRECGCEAQDLAALFEDAFVQDLQLFGCGRDELAGVGESGD